MNSPAAAGRALVLPAQQRLVADHRAVIQRTIGW
jgi:hypothetical protein